MNSEGFADRLVDAIERTGAPACVGLDPVMERMPEAVRTGDEAETIQAFCLGVVESVAGIVPAVKPQSACFERYGAAGFRVLEQVCAAARGAGLIVILDAKRGDIGISAQHYAASAVRLGADAITVNAYLGPSTVEPYVEAGLGVFVLVRTSNPDSNGVQSLGLTDGRTVADLMADLTVAIGESHVGRHAYSNVGAVVAATKPGDAARLRERMPRTIFLVPGYGAQGGSAETVRPLLDARGGGIIVTASRSVIYPPVARDWKGAIADAARAFVSEVRPLWRSGQ
jgi:orotidine-5'-phosphate decarboxylase